jgi:hypothetical protein
MKIRMVTFINSINLFNNMARSASGEMLNIEFRDGVVMIKKGGFNGVIVPLSNIVSMEVFGEQEERSVAHGVSKKAEGK